MREHQQRLLEQQYRQDYAYPYQQYQQQMPPQAQSITDPGPAPYSPTSSYSYTYDEAQPYAIPRSRAHSEPAQQPHSGVDTMPNVQHQIPMSYEDGQGPMSPHLQPPSPTVYSSDPTSGVGYQTSQSLDPDRALTPTTPQLMSEAASQVAGEEAEGVLPDLRNMFIPCAWPGCPLEACLWSTEEKKAYCVGCWPRMPFHSDIGLAVSADVLQRSGMVSQGQAQAEQGGSFMDTSMMASQANGPASWGASGSFRSGSAGFAQDHRGEAGEYANDLDSTDLAYAGYGDAFVYDPRDDPSKREVATDNGYDENQLSGHGELGPGRRYFEAVRRGVAGLQSAHRSRGLLDSRGRSSASSASEGRDPAQPSAAKRFAATRQNDEDYSAYLAQHDQGGGGRGGGLGAGAGTAADPMQTVASAGAVRLVEHPATVAKRIRDQRAARKRRYTIAKAKANERETFQAMAEKAERESKEEAKAKAEQAELETQKTAAGDEAKEEGGDGKGVTIAGPEKYPERDKDGTGSLSISTDVTGFDNVKQVRRPQNNNKPMTNYTKELLPDVPDSNFKLTQKQENFQKIGTTVVVMRPGVVVPPVGAPTGLGLQFGDI